MKRIALATLAAAGLSLGLAGSAHAARGVTVKGSDTMVILGQRWAERYMASNPGAIIQVTGGGSGTGIAALINGTTDICMSSRPMKEDEKRKLRDRFQTHGRRDSGGEGRAHDLRERDRHPVQVAALDQLRADLHGQDHELEGSRRQGRA